MRLTWVGRLRCVCLLFAINMPGAQAASLPVGFYENASGSPLVNMLDAARRSIDIEIYEMYDTRVLAAIRSALARGVRVRIIAEPKPAGQHCDIFGADSHDDVPACRDGKRLVRDVRRRGGRYEPFAKAALCDAGTSACLQHGKMVIVDGRTALISTGNFNSSNLCSLEQEPPTCNRDYTYVTDDRTDVDILATVFAHDLDAEPYDLETVIGGRGHVTVSPGSLAPLIAFIDSAEQSIQIENQYLDQPDLNEALLAAAERGVDIEITVSSACAFGWPRSKRKAAVRKIFSDFDAAGISSRMFTHRTSIQGRPGYMHAKAIVVDGAVAWIGSMNGSNAAALRNREFGIFFTAPDDVRALSAHMHADHRAPEGESWQESLACKKDDPQRP